MTKENRKGLCEEMELLIDDQLDGMISLSDKQKLENHIAVCDSCKLYLKNTLETINQLDSLNSKKNIIESADKEIIWDKVLKNIDLTEHALKNNTGDIEPANSYNLFKKKYYWISGIAAVIAVFFIVYAVKNWNFTSGENSLEYSFGLPTYWKVVNLKGSPQIGDSKISGSDSIKEGQWIITDSNSMAELIITDIGKVTIEPGSKVVFINGADSSGKIFVEYGMINTQTINDKNKLFMVEMPSAIAENFGGSYSLKIDKKGDGMIFVKSGKVDIQSPNKMAIVPAGNIVMTKNGIGVGTPFNEKASTKFRNALFDYDFGNCNNYCVNVLLDNAKMTDAVSLVNILNGKPVDQEIKNEIYNKIVNYVPPPSNSKSDSIHNFDEKEFEIWIENIQKKVETEMKSSMQQLEKNLSEYQWDIKEFYFDSAKFYFAPENFEIPENPEVPKGVHQFKYDFDSSYFDSEKFKNEMEKVKAEIKKENDINKEELNKELKKVQEEINRTKSYNKDELNKEMEELNKELEELNKNLEENIYFDSEEFKKEMKKVKEEIKNSVKEYNENYQNQNDELNEVPEIPEKENNDTSPEDDSDN
ncbi:MAG: zf-HC2 domain-containing protein [Ignavibacteria bacterium]